ncbi:MULTISPECIES: MarR family winged helix-turn-helix transcriptional regulator [Pontibacillus]|uniref:MarR family transcriptional regulator n=1 Tax=Pontibacillus chungwhensis TaxID=265426 RepID=A0ABY8UTE2_9BACI|nr:MULTISPECIES: MarR family transcriptional regulator [Pontibacillus]MCD5323388.1 MarR family transcriptional regulator [Pontibacillus sp. HN14]WIF96769.1 MarR family transcriptional regulator [Pontibacillus chungwhensis]
MSEQSVELIERQITDFIRRIVMTEQRKGRMERSAYILLRQLSSFGPAGVKTLSEELHLDISTVSRQATKLVEKQYVEKLPNPDDKRAYFYKITELGSKELEGNKQQRFERLEEMLKDWTEEEQETFGRLLKKYNETVNERLNF